MAADIIDSSSETFKDKNLKIQIFQARQRIAQLGKELKSLRLQNNLTLRKVADILGIDPSRLSIIENFNETPIDVNDENRVIDNLPMFCDPKTNTDITIEFIKDRLKNRARLEDQIISRFLS